MCLIWFFLMSDCPHRWLQVELINLWLVFALFLTLFKDLKHSHITLGICPVAGCVFHWGSSEMTDQIKGKRWRFKHKILLGPADDFIFVPLILKPLKLHQMVKAANLWFLLKHKTYGHQRGFSRTGPVHAAPWFTGNCCHFIYVLTESPAASGQISTD